MPRPPRAAARVPAERVSFPPPRRRGLVNTPITATWMACPGRSISPEFRQMRLILDCIRPDQVGRGPPPRGVRRAWWEQLSEQTPRVWDAGSGCLWFADSAPVWLGGAGQSLVLCGDGRRSRGAEPSRGLRGPVPSPGVIMEELLHPIPVPILMDLCPLVWPEGAHPDGEPSVLPFAPRLHHSLWTSLQQGRRFHPTPLPHGAERGWNHGPASPDGTVSLFFSLY